MPIIQEFFRNIEGYKGLYQISNTGRVRSFKNKDSIILKPGTNNRGYQYVNLSFLGKYKSIGIHRLVAIYFVKGNKKLTVNHKDGNKLNNTSNNLEWCSMKDNHDHFKSNHLYKISGENNGKSKLKAKDIILIKKLYKNKKHSSRSLAHRFSVSKTQVLDIINNKAWVNCE